MLTVLDQPAHRLPALILPALILPALILPARPTSRLLALAALGIVNTGVAYWLFYLLIDEAGAATASVITYMMPAVALFLGIGLLGEQLTVGVVAGLALMALGAWLATSLRRLSIRLVRL